jgi:hypothetical protein
MGCPDKLRDIVLEIISDGVLTIRARATDGNAARCVVEADHIHNLPDLIRLYSPDLLRFYWNIERGAFISRSTPREIVRFEATWGRLAGFIQANLENLGGDFEGISEPTSR